MSTKRSLIESALLDHRAKMAEMFKKEKELEKQLKENTEMEPDQILIGRMLFRNKEGQYFNADMSIEFCRRQNGLWRCYVGRSLLDSCFEEKSLSELINTLKLKLKAKGREIQEVLEEIEDPKTTEPTYFIWPEEG